jgi:hypothetical protein
MRPSVRLRCSLNTRNAKKPKNLASAIAQRCGTALTSEQKDLSAAYSAFA